MTRQEYLQKTKIQTVEEAKRYLHHTRILFWSVFIALALLNGLESSIDESAYGVFSIGYLFLVIYFVVFCVKVINLTKDVTSAHALWSIFFAPVSWLWFYPDLTRPLKIIIGQIEPPENLPIKRSNKASKKRSDRTFWSAVLISAAVFISLIIGVLIWIVLQTDNQQQSASNTVQRVESLQEEKPAMLTGGSTNSRIKEVLAQESKNTEEYTGALSDQAQREIAQSVVNVYCESTMDGEPSGGSGTIITKEGLVLTNSHVIPQDEDNVHVSDNGCLVILPDPVSGQPSEMYYAKPIVLKGLSDQYDLALLQIYAAYYDDEQKEFLGTFPKDFPAFDDTKCNNESVRLGEYVRIFGYPAISGGISLTITDGVVSSLPGDGLIVTSAKISHGNSGGLAVDQKGCMIGVPTMISSDEAETLGIIISMELLNEFAEEASKLQ